MPGKAGKETINPASLGFLALFLFLDRASKVYIQNTFSPGESVNLIPSVFSLTYVRNYGAAFGLLKHQTIFLITLALLFSGFILYRFILKSPKERGEHPLPWILLLAGTLGNLYDRVRFGVVIDFLDFHVWPVFNLADTFICLGVFWLVVTSFKKSAH